VYRMRITSTVLLCAVLGGCSLSMPSISMPSISSPAEAPASAARPAEQYVGKKLDTLIAQLGPPKRSQPLENDQTSYVWQFETIDPPQHPTGDGGLVYGDGVSPGYVSEGYTPFCRITVVASADGVVTQANTEESNGTGTPNGFVRSGNICQKQLKSRSRG
jgi:hypothetical protein